MRHRLYETSAAPKPSRRGERGEKHRTRASQSGPKRFTFHVAPRARIVNFAARNICLLKPRSAKTRDLAILPQGVVSSGGFALTRHLAWNGGLKRTRPTQFHGIDPLAPQRAIDHA